MVFITIIRHAIQQRSRMFLPTPIHLPRESRSKSQPLLQDAAIIHSVEHGFPQLLPTGFRVLTKLKSLIRNEMNNVGGQELCLSAVGRKTIWEISDRWNLMHEELFKFKDHDEEYCLSPTHEEAITKLVSSVCKSLPRSNYPLLVYQITWKYRNERNYRHGLLRTKEFLMKDLYSFHRDEECARVVYDQVCDAYERIFKKLELNCFKVPADSGLMGGSLNHEFLAVSPVGEDTLLVCPECNRGSLKNKAQCEHTQKIEQRAIEIGHCFLLGDRYTKAFNAIEGSSDIAVDKKPLVMGCYGIGVTRLMAATVEILTPKDSDDIHWPRRIVPYQVAILPPKKGSPEEANGNEKTLGRLLNLSNTEWFVDDRTELTIGYRLKDCQKMGIPIVIAFGKRATKQNLCEIIDVYNNRTEYLDYEDTLKFIQDYYSAFC
ncbi:unnamed protein product [Rotaria socialis]|uniref:proline--tRNA ligase n=1 Tax=Rotaria socialis TaxID=392032 RepID=A0A818G1L4_9BILA|nr:unnamed protein product [Rotaria socialis]CAF4686051.1 unnamed protein product [Rotaria socialis]